MADQGKYGPLQRHLTELDGGEWQASFADIEAVIGDSLPASARSRRSWWANDRSHGHARVWLDAGWQTANVDMAAESLRFQRTPAPGN